MPPGRGVGHATCVARKRREGESVVKPTLQRSVSLAQLALALAGQARGSLPSNRIVVATNTVQFPENRKLSEVDWSSFLRPSSNSNVDRGTEHDNDRSSKTSQRFLGWLEIPSAYVQQIQKGMQ